MIMRREQRDEGPVHNSPCSGEIILSIFPEYSRITPRRLSFEKKFLVCAWIFWAEEVPLVLLFLSVSSPRTFTGS